MEIEQVAPVVKEDGVDNSHAGRFCPVRTGGRR